jgi:hypothetical protein
LTLAALLQLVQILSGAGAAAVDLAKIVEAVQKRGDTKLTDGEAATVRGHLAAHATAMSAYDEMTQLEETSGA